MLGTRTGRVRTPIEVALTSRQKQTGLSHFCDLLVVGSGSGLVVSWEQETGILLASGDVRFIRVWDTQREMRMQVGPGEKNRSCHVTHKALRFYVCLSILFRKAAKKGLTKRLKK